MSARLLKKVSKEQEQQQHQEEGEEEEEEESPDLSTRSAVNQFDLFNDDDSDQISGSDTDYIHKYSHLVALDFSDNVPTLPPKNLQNFMVELRMREAEQNGGQIADPLGGGGPALHDIANRNALAALFESMLAWVHYGPREYEPNEENQVNDHDQRNED